MKKVMSMMLVAAMLLSLMSGMVFAAEPDTLVITADDVKATPGSTAIVTLQVEQNPGFMGLSIYPTDASGAPLTWNWTANNDDSALDFDLNDGAMIVLTADENITGTGALLDVELTIDAEVEPGEYTISFVAYEGECLNEDLDEVPVEMPTVTITVVECLHRHTRTIAAKEPTCTEDGNTAGWFCNDCQSYGGGYETVPALGHKDEDGDGYCDNNCGLTYRTELVLTAAAEPAALQTNNWTTVTLQVDYNPGFDAISFQPVITGADGVVNWEWEVVSYNTFFALNEVGTIQLTADEAYTAIGTLLVVRFYVDDATPIGEYTVAFNVESAVEVVLDPIVVAVLDCPHENVRVTEAVEPTCTEAGNTEGRFCEDCQTWLTESEVIPALNHKDEDGDRICDNGCGFEWPENLNTLVITAESVTVPKGNWAVVTLRVEYNPGFEHISFYPNAIWQWKADNSNTRFPSVYLQGGQVITMAATSETTDTGILLDVLFFVGEDVENGAYTVSFTSVAPECYNANGELIQVDLPEVVITVREHRHEDVEGKLPTCTEDGYSAGVYCHDCGCYVSGHEVFPAPGHDFQNGSCTACGEIDPNYVPGTPDKPIDPPAHTHTEEIIPGTAATCGATGLTEGKKCSVCGEILVAQEEIAALEHSYESVVTEPTCEAGGYTTHTCTACGHSYRDAATAKRQHKWDDGVIVKEATCTRPGSKQVSCSYDNCDAFYFDNLVPATGHTEETIPAVAATCTATGLTEGKKCSVCGEILVAQEQTATVEHTFGEWTVSKEATRKEAGEETRSCACGETETREIAPLGGINPLVIVIIVIVVLGVAAVVVFVVLKKKRA